jgi:hypothetical protein
LAGRAAGGGSPPSTGQTNGRGPTPGSSARGCSGGALIVSACSSCHDPADIVLYARQRNSGQPPPTRAEYEALIARENARGGTLSAADTPCAAVWLLGQRPVR